MKLFRKYPGAALAFALLIVGVVFAQFSPPSGGGNGTPGGSSGQIQYNNAGSFGGFTMAGDCSFAQPNITCTKTGGISFGAAATHGASITVGGATCTLDSSCTPSGSGALLPWNPANSAPPVLSNWTLINGTSNATTADVTNGVQISGSGASGFDGLYVAAPGSSGSAFTVTAHINGICYQTTIGGGARYGIWIGDTGTKKVEFEVGDVTSIAQSAGRYNVNYWTGNTDSGVTVPFTGPQLAYTDEIWFRIVYDATNFKFRISGTGNDSAAWQELTSLAANANLATNPSKVGFNMYTQAASGVCNLVLDYWNVSQP